MLAPIDWLILNTGGSLTTEKGGSGGALRRTRWQLLMNLQPQLGLELHDSMTWKFNTGEKHKKVHTTDSMMPAIF